MLHVILLPTDIRREKQVAVFLVVDEGIKKPRKFRGFSVSWVLYYNMGFQGNFIYPASIVGGVLKHHPYNHHLVLDHHIDPCLYYC